MMDDKVTDEWLGGEIRTCSRKPEYPLPTAFSRQVMRRIVEGRTPKRNLMKILQWRGNDGNEAEA